MQEDAAPGATGEPTAAPSAAVKRVTSDDLLGAAREIEIEHAGRVYRMRITRSGKLILTA